MELSQLAYPQFTVKSLGSCASVIAATKIFRALRDMHHIDRFFKIKNGTYIEKIKEMAKRGLGGIPIYLMNYLPDFASRLNLSLKRSRERRFLHKPSL